MQRVLFFFPFQLLLVHLKRNHILLLYWLLLFGLVGQAFANKYGLPHLLLYPEYLGQVNFLSHIFLGAACGSFVMAFQISSYIMNGFRFPFIATLARPFLKYQINNFIIPLSFYSYYVYKILDFQLNVELLDPTSVGFNLAGFLLGNFFFIGLSTAYFISTNKSIFKLLNISPEDPRNRKLRPIQNLLEPDVKWYQFLKRNSEWRIETYITGKLRIGLARSSRHYDRSVLKSVFKQNHLNASLFELVALLSIFVLGLFMEQPIFAIPAGASIFLLLTLILLFSGALHHWLKGWSFFGFVLIFMLLNLGMDVGLFRRSNQAYGLNYSISPVAYNNRVIQQKLGNPQEIDISFEREVNSLNEWKRRSGSDVLVLINTSGGGLRSATWAFNCLQQSDSLLNYELFPSVRLISGASGGMIGSAFYRDLILHRMLSDSSGGVSGAYIDDIAGDILNPLAFSWVVNDMLIHYKTFELGKHSYTKDRAYYFEKQLNENTRKLFEKPLAYYSEPVDRGVIPEMILTPSITNDGRRLLVASRNTLYMNKGLSPRRISQIGRVDFHALFKSHESDSMRFSTALRMNATFPYVLPSVTLPSEPVLEVMDAGARDNYGTLTSIEYLQSMQGWIDTAVKKVVVLRIFDRPDDIRIKQDPKVSLVNSISSPLGSLYYNLFNIQHMNEAQLFELIPPILEEKVEVVDFVLKEETGAEIPLSWHLTERAKNNIKRGFYSVENTRSMDRLKALIRP